MAEQLQTPKFDSTLGALFLGNVFAAIFYGATCVQTYVYYGKNHKDYLAVKILIAFLWFLDSFQLALITHGSYRYLVSNFGNISASGSPIWSILVQIYLTSTTDVLIRAFFGRRVWLISGRNIILTGCVAATSGLSFVSALVYVSIAFTLGSFEHFSKLSYLLYVGLGSAAAADVLIAVSLCIALSSSRRGLGSGLKKSVSVINVIMMYTINTCPLMTILSIVALLTYATMPGTLIFVGLLYSRSKLHFNSLLATLNTRKALLEKLENAALSDLVRNEDYPVNPVSDLKFKPLVLDISREMELSAPTGRREGSHVYLEP